MAIHKNWNNTPICRAANAYSRKYNLTAEWSEVTCKSCLKQKPQQQLEQAVDEACENEAIECTREEREQFVYLQRAYDNAGCYADQFGVDIDEFRRFLCKSRWFQPEAR